MKLIFENWREFVKQEVEEFLPHGEVRAVEKIGSSVLPPEEQAKQDLEKYGYVRDEDDRDIDIEVQIAHITNEEAEEWAFSREAQELEDYYNYDVQLRIVENWRKFMSEEVSGKQATGYHGTWVVPDKFQKIFRSGAFKSGEGKEKGPGYGAGLYVLIDPNPESKTMMGHYGPHIYKFDFSLDDFIIFDPELSEQVYGKNASIADQLRAMGKGELVDDMVEQMEKYDWGKEDEETMALRTREALEAPLELVLQPDGTPRVYNLKAQNYANLLQPHVNGMVFTAGSEKGTIAVLFKPEVAKLTGYAEYPGNAYMGKDKPVPLGPGVGEKWLDYTTKKTKQDYPDWEPNEYMLNKAKSFSEFPNFRPLEEAVDPKMKKYLKKHPYMEPDQLQEEAAGQCFPFAVEMANAVPDDEFDDMSKFKVVHGRITDKFSGETTLHAWVEKGDVVFDWQTSATKPKGISKVSYYDIFQPEVHAEYTAEELLVNCMKQGHKGPFNLSEDLQGEAVEDVYTGNCGMFGIALAEEAQRRGVDASLVFAHNADTDQELAYGDYKLYHVALKIGDKYYDGRGEIQLKELVSFMWEKPEDMNVDAFNLKNLELMKDAIRRNTAWTETCEYYREQASEFLDEMGYEALSEESEFQTKMKKNLPAELDFLLNKGPHNKKEGSGVKNPPKPKFKSAPPGAPGGKRNDD